MRDGLLKLFGLCVLAGVLVAGMLFPVAGSLGVMSNSASDTVRALSTNLLTTDPPLVTTITDRDGKPIAYLYKQDRTPVAPNQIADTMKAAIVSIEDQRFFDHHGVDWQGTIRAALTNKASGSISQGGSTLTQQYVKNYMVHVIAGDDPVQQQKAIEQTPARKLREIRIALQLEKQLNKEQVLTRYLNLVPFGNRAYGVASAARTYFNTTPDRLTIAQAALLAGMVNSPTGLNPEVNPQDALNRRNTVINAMAQQHRITEEAANAARNEPLGLSLPLHTLQNGCVGAGPSDGFFCQYVIDYLTEAGFSEDQLRRGGYTIRTSLDQRATAAAKASAEKQVPKNTPGIANVMSIVQPGRTKHLVRALVANRDFGLDPSAGETAYSLPSGVAKFGAGSIFKTFTSAAAMEQGMGIDNIVDAPPSFTSRVYKNNGHPYTVHNAEGVAPGPRTLQMALATSPNTTFVALQEKVGLANAVDMATRLGLRKSLNAVSASGDPIDLSGASGPSQGDAIKQSNFGPFTLGYGPVSPMELSNVAATLISGGRWCPPSPIEQILDEHGNPVSITEEPCEQAVDEQLANTLAVGMSKDPLPGGTAAAAAGAAHWTRPMLSKTGTTEQSQSAGFLGATPQYAGAVLTFTDSPHPEGICDSDPPRLCGVDNGNIFGGKIPARTWFDAMNPIHEGLPVVPLPPESPRYADGGAAAAEPPNVVGMEAPRAVEVLTKAGYRVDQRNMSSERFKGTVTGQTPRGVTQRGEVVTIYISTGFVPPPVTMFPKPPPPASGQPAAPPPR